MTKADLIQYKTENQIFNDFINLVKTVYDVFGVEGWQVRQLNQVFKTNVLKPTVFISVINTKQRGRQYTSSSKGDDVINRRKSTKQEVTIRFSATHRELETDTLQTLNSTDVLKFIREYMQSDEGILYLAGLNYAQYTAGEVSEQNFTNDEDNFQFMPFFDCTFVYTQTWQSEIGIITKFQQTGIYKV